MMPRAWSSIVQVPYCFSRSYVKFQGHTALRIVEFDPNWAFPDSNSSLNSPMAMKCCTKLETAKERCPIVFQGHPSNFKVTYKTSPILTQIGRFRTIGRSQLSNPSDLPCFRGHLAACTKFKPDRPTETIKRVNVDYCMYLPFMSTLSFVFCIYGSHYSHTAWWKPIFMENWCFYKRIKSKIICSPDLIFGLAEHLVTLTLYTALPLYHLEEMCHPDLIFWPALLFGTWEYGLSQ